MRKGEVYALVQSSEEARDGRSRRYFVVLSSDVHNGAHDTLEVVVAPVRRRPLRAFSVTTIDADPVRGHVDIRELLRLPVGLLDSYSGMLTGATMVQVSQEIKKFFDIP